MSLQTLSAYFSFRPHIVNSLQDTSNYQIDALQIKGPLDEQVKQAMAFLKRNQTITATKEPQRKESPQFSEKAVFEAIVNAVAHRDYSISGSKIRFFTKYLRNAAFFGLLL